MTIRHRRIRVRASALVLVLFAVASDALAAQSTRQPARLASPTEASMPTAWRASVAAAIRADEYAFSPVGDAVWSAPNRAQRLRSRIGARGIEVFPRETSADGAGAAWKLRLRTASFGRSGYLRSVGGAAPIADGARAELGHGAIVEWFANDERGIEQGWTIARRPPGNAPLVIGLAYEGDLAPRIDGGARSAVFVDRAGEALLRYTALVARDAAGVELRAWMAPSPNGLLVGVDDAGATYPVTVDPLLSSPAWITQADQADAEFGLSVATAGDVNGDGYSDVVVGAPLYDHGEMDEGRAYLYEGAPFGLRFEPSWSGEPNVPGAQFGYSVATAGDVDGDGYADVIVGAWLATDGDQIDEGRAYVYHGSASGLNTDASWIGEGNQLGATFGYSVSSAGDVNGDGYADVIVGARSFDNGQQNEGRAFVFEGSATGLSEVAAWTAESNQAGAFFGISVSCAGDVNGDGYSDVVVGASNYSNGETKEGRAYVFEGSAAGLDPVAAWTAESNQMSAAFGISVATAGDVNGDGFDDVAVGARLYSNGQGLEGRAYVYYGSPAGPSLTADWTAESNQGLAYFGASVSTAGDVNGDGYADLVVGSYLYSNPEYREGRAWLYLGSSTGLASTAAWIAESNEARALFGVSVSTAGDVDGDGYSDVIVGASSFGSQDEGGAFLYRGSASGLHSSLLTTPAPAGSLLRTPPATTAGH